MNNAHIIFYFSHYTQASTKRSFLYVSTFTFITKEIVDKDFKFGYVCKFQYAIKSTA